MGIEVVVVSTRVTAFIIKSPPPSKKRRRRFRHLQRHFFFRHYLGFTVSNALFFLSFFSFFRGKVDLHISKRSKGKVFVKTKAFQGESKEREERVVGSSSLRRERKSVFLSAQKRDATFDVWTKESAFANLETAAARAFLLSRGYA